MTALEKLYTALASSGLPVTYHSWPDDAAPPLPFVCYLETETDNVFGDMKTYKIVRGVDVELYTKTKDPVSEGKLETVFANNEITWNKRETYLGDERCFQTTYEIEVIENG